jgi:hypothetical protein
MSKFIRIKDVIYNKDEIVSISIEHDIQDELAPRRVIKIVLKNGTEAFFCYQNKREAQIALDGIWQRV